MAYTPPAELPKVLYADDDARAVALFKEQVGGHFAVTTTQSGSLGLELLKNEGPFAVVLSDYQMIGMSGLTFLSKVKEVSPDSTRLLITAHPDLTAAIGAINDGNCFRFMFKPCTRAIMVRNLEAAVEQYKLVTSRRVLLEQTLEASIKALTDVLALASPAAFGRTTRARGHVSALLHHFNITDRWEAEVAAMLSQIGCVSLPAETALKVYQGATLTPEEKAMADRLPALAEQLIADIPQMEGVRAILHYQDMHLDGSDPPPDSVREKQISWGARALRVALDFDVLETQGVESQVAFDKMRSRELRYDPQILEAFAQIRGVEQQTEVIQELEIKEVVTGMTFAEDVLTRTGMMLIARGTEVTPSLSERISNLKPNFVQEPVKVHVMRPVRSPMLDRP